MSYGGNGAGSGSIHASSDVALSNPADTEVLTYVSSIGKWENKPSTGSSGVQKDSLVVNVMDHGAKLDYKHVADVSINSGSASLSSGGTAGWTAADVGKTIWIAGAGSAGAGSNLLTTIQSVQSSTVVTLAATATASVSSGQAGWGSDDTAAIQAAINLVNAQYLTNSTAGGTVYLPGFGMSSMITLKAGVSLKGSDRKTAGLILKPGAGTSLIIADLFAANTLNASSTAYGAVGTPTYFDIQDLTLDGNAFNQPAPGTRSDYNQQNAIVKLWGYHMLLRNLELINARELALYTEHTANWESQFNYYQFAESNFENIYAKNYWQVGWVNRGPHDSVIRSCYLSSFTASGATAYYGYIQQSNNQYSSSGLLAFGLHVWGQHSANSVLLSGSNIIEGFIYAEGCTGSALQLVNVSSCNFDAFVGYCANGIELFSGASNNNIRGQIESNLSGSLFKLRAASGNVLEHRSGGGASAAIFDCTTGSGNYTGGNNTFKSAHPYNQTIFLGSVSTNDRVDTVSDNYPDANRLTRWELPLGATKLKISEAGLDLGGLPLLNTSPAIGSIITSSQHASAYSLALADIGTAVELTSGSAVTVTVPVSTSVAFPVGSLIEICQYGLGQVSLQAANGVVLHTAASLSTRTQYSSIALRMRASDEWVVSGDLAP